MTITISIYPGLASSGFEQLGPDCLKHKDHQMSIILLY